ncbi:MAG: hypothetical protein Q8P79_01710 [Nanoarchaeota archaeon]|nr:hypothetical protein [Nanoarchaeota archaeon]
MGKDGISGGELLQRVYDCLFYEQVEEVVELEEPVCILVADDSDHHRIRRGYMKYVDGKVISLDEKNWFIGVGEPHGDYPADKYAGDIRIWRGRRPSLPSLLDGFSNSAIVITSKGNLAISKYDPFKDLQDLLKEADNYDLTPNLQTTTYKPEFADLVVRRIEETLRKHSMAQ